MDIAAESGSGESFMLWSTATYAGVGQRLCKIKVIIDWNLHKKILEEILKRNINYPGTNLVLYKIGFAIIYLKKSTIKENV